MILGSVRVVGQSVETHRDSYLLSHLTVISVRRPLLPGGGLAKLYEDRNGKLQETSSFSANELLRVAELAREAHGVIRGLRREQSVERGSRSTDDAPASERSSEARPARFRDRPQSGHAR